MTRRSLVILFVPLTLIIFGLWGCDPDQDSPDYATITGYIYTDSTMAQGVSGVRVIVESDIESEVPYSGPDQFGWTDNNGHFSISFYLGHENVAGNVVEHTYIADCAVSYWHQGHFFAWTGGVTVASGKEYTLPNVHLGQFE